jgi:hypothetical protein
LAGDSGSGVIDFSLSEPSSSGSGSRKELVFWELVCFGVWEGSDVGVKNFSTDFIADERKLGFEGGVLENNIGGNGVLVDCSFRFGV